MKQFTNLYPVSKTLRFELQPIGKTRENIEKNGILQRDEKRAEDYKIVKSFIDEYHKQFIKDRLWSFKLPLHSEGNLDSLEEYQALYELSKRNDVQEAEFTEIKDNLRSIIAKRLTESGSSYERIFKKELIREDLIDFLESNEDKISSDNLQTSLPISQASTRIGVICMWQKKNQLQSLIGSFIRTCPSLWTT